MPWPEGSPRLSRFPPQLQTPLRIYTDSSPGRRNCQLSATSCAGGHFLSWMETTGKWSRRHRSAISASDDNEVTICRGSPIFANLTDRTTSPCRRHPRSPACSTADGDGGNPREFSRAGGRNEPGAMNHEPGQSNKTTTGHSVSRTAPPRIQDGEQAWTRTSTCPGPNSPYAGRAAGCRSRSAGGRVNCPGGGRPRRSPWAFGPCEAPRRPNYRHLSNHGHRSQGDPPVAEQRPTGRPARYADRPSGLE